MNRFQNCKTLLDLQNILGDGIGYDDLTADERARLVLVFNANAGEDVSLPLTPAGYGYICGETCKYVAQIAASELSVNYNNNNVNLEENVMKSTDTVIKNAVNAAAEVIREATANVRVRAGEDVASFKDKADESITTIKDATFSVLGVLDRLTGASVLKNDLLRVLYKNSERSSKRGFFDAADECRRLVYEHIDNILAYDPDENDFKEVVALRYLIGEDENGKPIVGHRSIFSAFANGIVWIAKKVTRKLRAWFGVDAETNIFGTIGASLASIFGMAAGVIGSVLKVALHTVIFVGSYVVSAVIKAVAFVWDKIKGFGAFMKSKFGKEHAKEDAADDEALKAEAQADAK